MRLLEWQYMSKPAASTASSSGYKKRFEKLIKYHIDHASSELERVIRKDIRNDSFLLGEHYNDGKNEFDRDIIVSVEADGTFYLNIFVDGKEVYRNEYESYEELLELLTGSYMYLPDEGTQDYDELLTEALTEELKNIPEKLYHATYKQFLKSIQQKGLGNTRRKMWTDSVRGVVYLANDPWVAESYAEESEWVDEQDDPDAYLENIIILEIDTTKLDVSKFEVDKNVILEPDEENSTWEYHGIIPWEACKIFGSNIVEDFNTYDKLWN
jgi:hypothetical protein